MLGSWDQLESWLASDSEISDPSLDAFGHSTVADRMARRLSAEQRPTMMLVGPRGSGKSSIGRLVETKLKPDGETIFIRVSLWPFHSTKSAVGGILSAILDGLSQRADTLAVAGLPNKYLEIVAAADPRLVGAVNLLRGPQDPHKVLGELDTIATAIGARIVLWVEDFERFVPTLGTGAGTAPGERVAPIRSLLHLLDQCRAITVVAAADTLDGRFDAEKIARFIAPPDVWRIVDQFRKRMLTYRPFIDPASPEARGQLDKPSDYTELAAWLMDHHTPHPQPQLDFARAVDTPRQLKQTLRLAQDIWSTLHGEIDFDDVLLTSAIRVASPNLYAFIDRNITTLCTNPGNSLHLDSNDPRGPDNEIHEVQRQFEETLAAISDAEVASALRMLVVHLFPNSGRSRFAGDRPQGIAAHGPSDYWVRYNSQAPVDPAESDQRALLVMQEYQEGESDEVVDWIVDESRNSRISAFGSRFEPEEVIELIDAVCAHGEAMRPSGFREQHSPGLYCLRRIMTRSRHDFRESLRECVVRLTKKYVPSNLPLAFELLNVLGDEGGRGHGSLLRSEGVAEVREVFVSSMLDAFVGRPDELARALRGSQEQHLLHWCSWGLAAVRENRASAGEPFDGWAGFSGTILHAAHAHRATVLPQVLGFFSHQASGVTVDGTHGYWADVNQDHAFELFDPDELRELLQPSEPEPEWADYTRQCYEKSRESLLTP